MYLVEVESNHMPGAGIQVPEKMEVSLMKVEDGAGTEKDVKNAG